MKNLGTISLISLAINVLGLIFGPFLSIIFIILANSEYGIVTVNTSLIIICIICIGTTIWKFISNIQFLGALKIAGENTENIDLLRCYRRELAHFILYFITLVFIAILLWLFFYLAPISTLSTYTLLSLASIIINTILSILMTVSLENWTENVKNVYFQIPFTFLISKGVNNMKIGRIIQIFLRFFGLGFIGEIMFCSGLISAGKNIMSLVNVLGNYQSQPINTMVNNPSGMINLQAQISTQNPILDQQNHCPYCGTVVLVKGTTFCGKCGKKIQ